MEGKLIIAFFGVLAILVLIIIWFVIRNNRLKRLINLMEEENLLLNKSRTEFISNIAHELKTPLTSISGFAQTLQSKTDIDDISRDRFINIIVDESERLQRLIDSVMQLSELEHTSENTRFLNTSIDIVQAVDTSVSLLSNFAIDKNISIYKNIDETIILYGNPDKFKQMVLNLIDNAIKYGKNNGNVWIDIFREDKFVMISVKDDGLGIAPDDISRLTERFYRGDKSRSQVITGTGIGLSIVKHTAKLFNGELDIKSELGKGSAFKIKILQ